MVAPRGVLSTCVIRHMHRNETEIGRVAEKPRNAAGEDTVRRITTETERTARDFGPAVRPIFLERPNGQFELVGSCVLCQIMNRYVVLTAAHVVDHAKRGSLYLGGIADTFLIDATIYSSSPAVVATGHGDPIDIAFLELNPGYVQPLGNVRFITMEEVDVDDAAHPAPVYFCVGYPVRFETRNDLTRSFALTGQVFTNVEANEQQYRQHSLKRQTHLAIRVDQKKVIISGQRVRLHMEGMSGGGAWRHGSLQPVSDFQGADRLVGVVIEHRSGSYGVLVCTRVSHFLEAIRRVWPELSSAIPASTYLEVVQVEPRRD